MMLIHPMRTLLAVVMIPVALAAAQRPSFRSTVELVLLNVTVTDSEQRFVGDLTADDFLLFENGKPQEIAYFAGAVTPLSVSLVIDTSSSMDDELAIAQQAARDFVSRLRPADVAEIVDFDSRVEVLQPMTSDRKLLDDAIGRLRAGGATSMYNAIYIALSQFAKTKPATLDDVRRQVIVVLSDGEDTSSLVTFEQLIDTAKRSQTVIFTIGLGLAEPTTKRSDGEFSLRALSKETGGRMFLPKRPADLADVYGQISRELTTQYVLGFLSTSTGGAGWRSLAVRVKPPNLQARTRAGYYASN